MLRENTMDVLLRIGMPAGIKGVAYICDALELFDTDPYYPDGKICCLYGDIAKRHDTTASRVERAIRHAFEVALTRGKPEMIERYLDTANTQNSNLLKNLYFRIQNEERNLGGSSKCSSRSCSVKQQIYQEAMQEAINVLYREMEMSLARRTETAEREREYFYQAR